MHDPIPRNTIKSFIIFSLISDTALKKRKREERKKEKNKNRNIKDYRVMPKRAGRENGATSKKQRGITFTCVTIACAAVRA